MTKTWVIVANRTQANFFHHLGPGKGLERIDALENPAGRLKDHEINTDKPGRAFDSQGHGRHAMSSVESPHDRVAADFARTITHRIVDAKNRSRFEQLIVVAEARMLGLIRKALDSSHGINLIGSVDKDIVHENAQGVAKYVAHLLAV